MAKQTDSTKDHIILSLAKPYVIGARMQLKRYGEARIICNEDAVLGVYLCMHEVSTLFEDLNAIVEYFKRTGRIYTDDQLWVDIRHHIRHDLREEFDKDETRKTNRATRLSMHEHLQGDIRFDTDKIKVGGTEVALYRVEAYLDWANQEITQVFQAAIKTGHIKATGSPDTTSASGEDPKPPAK